MTDPETTIPRRATVWVVAVTTTVQALATMCTIVPAAIAPELARALGVPVSFIGFQVSLVYFGAMIMSMLSGQWVRRSGALRTSQWALGFSGAGLALAAAPSLAGLAVGSVLVGFGYGLTNPAASHLLMRVTMPENRNFVFSLKQTGVPLGAIAAGLAAPGLALTFGWQWAFLAGAGATLGFIALIQPFRGVWDQDRDPAVTLRQNPLADLGMVWRHMALRRMSMAAFCYSAVQISLSTFVVTMLVVDIHFSLVQAGVVLSVLMVAGASGRIFWGGLADRLRDANRVLQGVALIAAAAGLMTMVLDSASSGSVIYGVLIVFGLSAIGWNGVFLAETARLAPQGRIGSATGAALVPTFAGVLFGPVSFTGLYALTGQYTAAFGIFAGVSLIGFALVLAARRGQARG